MAILLFCLATYFSIGSRFLSMIGFHQFIGDDEITTDLVEEGRELIKRGKLLNISFMKDSHYGIKPGWIIGHYLFMV